MDIQESSYAEMRVKMYENIVKLNTVSQLGCFDVFEGLCFARAHTHTHTHTHTHCIGIRVCL